MGDHPDFSIPVSPGAMTEETPGYCRQGNFYEEKAITTGASYNFDFTIADTYFLYIPVSVTVSPLANTKFIAQILFATVEFFYGAAQALLEMPFNGLAGLQLLNGDVTRVTVINSDGSTRTFSVSLNCVKIFKPVGY